jgi:hypothetical protein
VGGVTDAAGRGAVAVWLGSGFGALTAKGEGKKEQKGRTRGNHEGGLISQAQPVDRRDGCELRADVAKNDGYDPRQANGGA